VIVLDRHARIGLATGPARRWPGEYFEPDGLPERLPDELARWLRGRRRHAGGEPGEPLKAARAGATLAVRRLPGAGPGGREVLLLDERREVPEPAALRAAGLTRREGEVLAPPQPTFAPFWRLQTCA